MNSTFWTNTIWYIALAAVSAAAVIVILVKARERRKTFAFLIAVLGFTYLIEVPLLLLFDAYAYHPMLTPEEPFFDSVIGNLFSQISVSSSAVLICVLGLSNWWTAAFSAVYFLIDVLFVSLGIYEHMWYRSIYTLAGFFIYASAVKYWYKKVFGSESKFFRYAAVFLSSWALTADFLITLPKLLHVRYFTSGLYSSDPSKSHAATALLFAAVLAAIMIALHKWKASWRLKALVLIILFICRTGLYHSGVIVSAPGWQLVFSLLDIAGCFGLTLMMDRFLSHTPQSKNALTTLCASNFALKRILTASKQRKVSYRRRAAAF